MMLALLIVGAAVVGSAGDGPAVIEHRYALDAWVLTVRDDRFADSRRCVLAGKRGDMLTQPGAVGFRARSPHTLTALYRVDGGRPVRWADRYPSLVSSGVEVEGGGLANPTGRIVWISMAELGQAREVTVRAGGSGWGRRYRLVGLPRMLASAKGLGCTLQPAF